MHSILVSENVRRVSTVLPSATGSDAIVFTIIAPVPIEQPNQLPLARLPIDVELPLGKTAGVAYAVVGDVQCRSDAVPGVFEFGIGGRPLVRHDAAGAENDLLGQAVIGLKLSLLLDVWTLAHAD